ncbi:MAG: c-type cytochrome [Ignavibacteria bacterium]|nr:c-type cytochrome [Ignavibacteria bacterium]MBL0108132.1 c-type cytochrome [Ignavibacteria bacterium]
MKTKLSALCFILISCIFLFSQCSDTGKDKNSLPKASYGGFDSQIKWGEHLVTIGGCNDCHTPKKMTPQGPVPDESLMLSGHPEKMPAPDVDRKEMESKGLIVTQDLTAWVGPWGISFAANITPDATGIGSWQESNFITALREGKFKGMTSARNLLPPMPWQLFKEMSDDEIKAIFAYLKSIKPVKNIVPQPEPPVSAPPGK